MGSSYATLPKPYPDELLYSILGRYYIRSGYSRVRKVQVKLFDTPFQQPWDILLPGNLNRLTRKLWTKANYTPDYFIQNHTLYPFYAQFLIPAEAELLRRTMIQQGNASIPMISKISLKIEETCQGYLKFCPQCFKHETDEIGEAYWHRTHQIPGVLVCPDHRVPLLNSAVCLKMNDLHYVAADSDSCQISDTTTLYTDLTIYMMTTYIETLECLINSHLSFRGLAWLRKRYQQYSIQKGFLEFETSTKFRFDESKFFDDFRSFYGEEFLNTVSPLSFQSSKDQFVQCLLACDLSQTINRVHHILLINFLAPTLQEFFIY